jgi:cytochrome c oxidase cbb3-type subunit III
MSTEKDNQNSTHGSDVPDGSLPRDAVRLLGHEYDGIQEYDNPMPRWWVWIFWGSFYFALGYFIHYHITGNGESVALAYDTDLALAREKEAMAAMGGEVTEESLGKLMSNGAMVADAAKLFAVRCAQCHGAKGEGLIGPNLTDNYWLHGNASLMSIHEVISEGVQTKGMPPWKKQLRPIELGKVTAYVGSLRGTNVPGPKGKEGQLVETAPTPASVAPAAATTAH